MKRFIVRYTTTLRANYLITAENEEQAAEEAWIMHNSKSLDDFQEYTDWDEEIEEISGEDF